MSINQPSTLNLDPERAPIYLAETLRSERYGRGHGDVVHDIEAFSLRERDTMLVYAEFMRPYKVSACATLLVRDGAAGGVTQLLTLGRYGTATFKQHELQCLRELRATISVALKLHRGRPMLPTAAIAELKELTKREIEVTTLVCKGLQNREIAALLGTSHHTIRNQLAAIFRKLGVSTRAELAGLAA